MASFREQIDAILNKKVTGGHVYYLVKWKPGLKRQPSWVVAEQLTGIPLMLMRFEKKLQEAQSRQYRPKIFAQMPVSPPVLGDDTVAKILGCKHSGGTVWYAVQFKQRPNGVCLGVRVYSHEQLLRHEPAVLGRFIAHKASLH